GGALNISADTGTGTNQIQRSLDLSGHINPQLSFDFSRTAGVDAADSVVLEVSRDGVNFTRLESFTGTAGANSGTRTYDLSGYSSSNTIVRFRVDAGYTDTNEDFVVDNVTITGQPTDHSASFSEGGSAVNIASGTQAAITDADSSSMSGATVKINN